MVWVIAALTAVIACWLIYASRVRSAMRASVLQGFYEGYAEYADWDEAELRDMGPRMLNRAVGYRLLNRKKIAWWWEGRALAVIMRDSEKVTDTLMHPEAEQVLVLHKGILSEQFNKQVAVAASANALAQQNGLDIDTCLRRMAVNLAENGKVEI